MNIENYKQVRMKANNTQTYIKILNGMFGLTDKEILVLEAFIEKYKQLKDLDIDVFSAEIKKKIAEELQMEDFNTLNVYIKRLKDKQAIRYKDGQYIVHPLLLRKEDEEGIIFGWTK